MKFSDQILEELVQEVKINKEKVKRWNEEMDALGKEIATCRDTRRLLAIDAILQQKQIEVKEGMTNIERKMDKLLLNQSDEQTERVLQRLSPEERVFIEERLKIVQKKN